MPCQAWLCWCCICSPFCNVTAAVAAAISSDSRDSWQGEGREPLPWSVCYLGYCASSWSSSFRLSEHLLSWSKRGHAWCTQVYTYLPLCEPARVGNGASQISRADQEWDCTYKEPSTLFTLFPTMPIPRASPQLLSLMLSISFSVFFLGNQLCLPIVCSLELGLLCFPIHLACLHSLSTHKWHLWHWPEAALTHLLSDLPSPPPPPRPQATAVSPLISFHSGPHRL